MNPTHLHQGLGPRCEKMEWRQRGIAFLPNLNSPNSRKYSFQFENLQLDSNLEHENKGPLRGI